MGKMEIIMIYYPIIYIGDLQYYQGKRSHEVTKYFQETTSTLAWEYSCFMSGLRIPPREASAIRAEKFHNDDIDVPRIIPASLPNGYSTLLLAQLAY